MNRLQTTTIRNQQPSFNPPHKQSDYFQPTSSSTLLLWEDLCAKCIDNYDGTNALNRKNHLILLGKQFFADSTKFLDFIRIVPDAANMLNVSISLSIYLQLQLSSILLHVHTHLDFFLTYSDHLIARLLTLLD